MAFALGYFIAAVWTMQRQILGGSFDLVLVAVAAWADYRTHTLLEHRKKEPLPLTTWVCTFRPKEQYFLELGFQYPTEFDTSAVKQRIEIAARVAH